MDEKPRFLTGLESPQEAHEIIRRNIEIIRRNLFLCRIGQMEQDERDGKRPEEAHGK